MGFTAPITPPVTDKMKAVGPTTTTVPLFNPHGDEGEMKAADNEDSCSLTLSLLSAPNDGELGAYKPWCL